MLSLLSTTLLQVGLAFGGGLDAAQLELGLSAGLLQQRDLQASPLRYGAQELSLRLGLGLERGPWSTHAALRTGVGNLHVAEIERRSFSFESVDPLSGEASVRQFPEPRGSAGGGLELAARRRLGDGPLRLGGALVGDALYTADGLALGTWAWSSLELGPSLSWTLQRDTHALQLAADISVISMVTRFPATLNPLLPDTGQVGGFYKTGTRLSGPVGHQALHLSARHTLLGPGPWSLSSSLRASWTRDLEPAPLYRLHGQLGLMAVRQLGGRP